MHDVSENVHNFTRRMAVAFGAPDTVNSGEFKVMLGERIGRLPEKVLTETADHFIETRKSWPKIADIVSVARQKAARAQAATGGTQRVRNYWAEAENFARRWFEQEADADMIGRAHIEGWTPDLFQIVKTLAWGMLVKGIEPQFTDIHVKPDWATYHANRARAYREAAEFQKTPEYIRVHGPKEKKRIGG